MKRSDPSTAVIGTLADLDQIRHPAGVALADPAAPDAQIVAGTVLLAVGVDVTAADRLITAAASSGAAAVLLRAPDSAASGSSGSTALGRLAAKRGIALYWLDAAVSWDDALHRLSVQDTAIASDDELADLAQTIASLTGGLVTIEDNASRVLAYSRSSDEVDDLRRLSILGRSGPSQYLALLREWGIYDRLANSEDVVEIAEHPESGVRRRLAVGVFAGRRQLGTIWVQQGPEPFGEHAKQALLGAARVTATHLISGPARTSTAPEDQLARLLGAPESDSASTAFSLNNAAPSGRSILGRAADNPCAIAVFSIVTSVDDPVEDRAAWDELGVLIRVQAAAFRRNAMLTQLAGRSYLLLPSTNTIASALPLLRDILAAAQQHVARPVRAAIGPIVNNVADINRSRAGADLALDGDHHSTGRLTTFDDVRPALLATAAVDAIAARPELNDSAVAEFGQRADTRTLLRYLDYGSDVTKVASLEKVHVTTVRHRLRKVTESLGLDLADPDQRLAMQLQLRAELRSWQ